MQTGILVRSGLVAAAFAGLLFAGQAGADKPDHAGGGKGEQGQNSGKDKHEKDKKAKQSGDDSIRVNGYFAEPQRVAVRDYYQQQQRAGKCPPGLAKKNNGCLPPGKTRKWAVGQPLPADVIYHSVPQPLVVQIGVPPPGYRYVQVSSDILLLAIGTGMVIDAIQGLSGN